MENESMGTRLKYARAQKKLTQRNVCEELGIPNSQTLSAYERDNNVPPCEMLKKLAVLYSVSTDWLLFGSEGIVQKEKSPFDYLSQIVEGVDKLGLALKMAAIEEDPYEPALKSMCIQLYDAKYPTIHKFSEVWWQFRHLRDNGSIRLADYELLLNNHLQDIRGTLTNDVSSEELPWQP